MKNSVRSILAIGALASVAAFVSANASEGRELVVSAPIQQLDHGADTVTVLGQKFHAQTGQLSIGEVVKVYGVLQKDGSVADAVVESTNEYATNGDPVFLKGVVTATDPALGHLEVDGMTVDYTSQLANANFAIPNVGDVIAVSASQPATQGVLVASAAGAGAYGGLNASGGALPSQIPGAGLSKAAQITGGGTAQITGGGTAQITGGGTAQITGGGTAQITGGGTAQITGGGTAQITGGGTAQITGGGTAQITGGGTAGMSGGAHSR